MNIHPLLALILFAAISHPAAAAGQCSDGTGYRLQILGSGGDTVRETRAGSSYLLWHNDHSRVLVNAGAGSALRFAQARGHMRDLEVILFNQVYADNTAALTGLVLSAQEDQRQTPLPIYGPGGRKNIPSTVALVRALFEISGGAYRHLGYVLAPLDKKGLKLQPHNVNVYYRDDIPTFGKNQVTKQILRTKTLTVSAATVSNDEVPTLGWRLDVGDVGVVFIDRTALANDHLDQLAKGAQTLVAPLPVMNGPLAREFPSPTRLAELANNAGIKTIILTHRSRSTVEDDQRILEQMANRFTGEIQFANDLDCYKLTDK
jgi:ribonuclease BN (tRNA processing enzyme)